MIYTLTNLLNIFFIEILLTKCILCIHLYVPDMVIGTIANPNIVTAPEWFIIYGEST